MKQYLKPEYLVLRISVIVWIAVVVFCFVPLREVAYTATEPLSYESNGFFYREPQRDPRKLPPATIEFSRGLEEVTAALREAYPSQKQATQAAKVEYPVGYVGVVNRDNISGMFTVHFIFYSSGEQYSKDITFQLNPNELGEAKYHATSVDANGDEWSWEYKVTPDTKTVTKQKRVTLLDYLLHY